MKKVPTENVKLSVFRVHKLKMIVHALKLLK